MENKQIQQLRKKALHQIFIALFLGTVIFIIGKFVLTSNHISTYFVELFIIATCIMYAIFYYSPIGKDDEYEVKKPKLQYSFGIIIFLGCFFVHFYSLALEYKTLPVFSFTSLYLSLLMIASVIQFRKNDVYFHQFDLNQKDKAISLIKNIIVLWLLLSVNLIPIFLFGTFTLFQPLIYTAITATIIYLLFFTYEYIEHKETKMFKEGKIRHISLVVVLFLFIPTLYTMIDYYFNAMIQYEVVFKDIQIPSYLMMRQAISRYRIETFVYMMFIYVYMFRYFKKNNFNALLVKLIIFKIGLSIVMFLYQAFGQYFINQYIDRYLDQMGSIATFLTRFSQVGIFLSFVDIFILLLAWLLIRPYRLKGHVLLLLSVITYTVTFFLRNISLTSKNEALFIANVFIHLIAITIVYLFLSIQTKSYRYLEKLETQ